VLTLLAFTVRRRLAAEKEKLTGLYAGNSKRSTAHPTAEAVLRAFKQITLTVITTGKQILNGSLFRFTQFTFELF
jgi:hypothetical protein